MFLGNFIKSDGFGILSIVETALTGSLTVYLCPHIVPIVDGTCSEGISHLELHIFAVASIYHSGSAADGGAIKVVSAAKLGSSSEAWGVTMAILHEQVGA